MSAREMDGAIADHNERARRLAEEGDHEAARLVANQASELVRNALALYGPRRRWTAVIAYKGKDWLGEAHRSEVMTRSITVQFLSRSTVPRELGEIARRSLYGPPFSNPDEWEVAALEVTT